MPCEEHPQVLRIAIGFAVHTRTHLLFMARSGSDKHVAWDDSGRADGSNSQRTPNLGKWAETGSVHA
jgi:hypothetical protein